MGVWGTGIFQDDTATDLRDDYGQLLGDGLTPSAAKARILETFKSSFADPDESTVAWLALAAVQWQRGRLDPDTLQHALTIIDSGSNLTRWDTNPNDREKRKAVLEKLRAQISSPQPPEKKVRKRALSVCPWKVGDLFSYRLLSGKLIVFRVIGHHKDKGGTYPVCEMLDWLGDEIPSGDVLRSLPWKPSQPMFGRAITKLMLVGLSKKWVARVQDLNLALDPAQTPDVPVTVEHFKYLDGFLKRFFQLE
jgi:hypothetical protein